MLLHKNILLKFHRAFLKAGDSEIPLSSYQCFIPQRAVSLQHVGYNFLIEMESLLSVYSYYNLNFP